MDRPDHSLSHLGAERRGVKQVVGAVALVVGLGTEVRDLAGPPVDDLPEGYTITTRTLPATPVSYWGDSGRCRPPPPPHGWGDVHPATDKTSLSGSLRANAGVS